jgi:hypothetical protein
VRGQLFFAAHSSLVRHRKKIKLGLEWLYYRPAKLIKREFRALAPLLQLHTQSAQKAAVITTAAAIFTPTEMTPEAVRSRINSAER